MIELQRIGKTFQTGESTLTVLHEIDLQVGAQEFIAITGPSGSGKSTLLGIMAGLDRPSQGRVVLDHVDITDLTESELALFRGRRLGFVFQSFQLIPTLTALENVRVPAELCRLTEKLKNAEHLLERVGLKDRAHHYPTQLSGGEMQRVAIARALITEPAIIFADEPTGNLDSSNGQKIVELLLETTRSSALVLVTHNPALAALADREIRLRDGRIVETIGKKKKGSKPGKARPARAPVKKGKR